MINRILMSAIISITLLFFYSPAYCTECKTEPVESYIKCLCDKLKSCSKAQLMDYIEKAESNLEEKHYNKILRALRDANLQPLQEHR